MEKTQNFFESTANQQEAKQKERWEIEVNDIMNLKLRLYSLLGEKFGDDNAGFTVEKDRINNGVYGRLLESGIREQDAIKVAAYNVFVGSTATFPKHEKIDFEGNLSIKKIFEEEIEKLQNLQK